MGRAILLLVLLPLVSATITHFLSTRIGRQAIRVSLIGAWLTLAVAISVFVMAIAGAEPSQWKGTTELAMLSFDPLGSIMALAISMISLMVHIYSVRYMADEPGYTRFFVLLGYMTSMLLCMVTAADLITLLIAWHLVGVLLYFLLGHDTRNDSVYRYASWTWLTYRFGDLPMVLAAVLLYLAYDSWSLEAIFSAAQNADEPVTFIGLPVDTLAATLIAAAAFARSAQFMLHTWLPYTMAGPTPVSALMHAGIVNAGGFIINRFSPLYVQAGDVLHWIFLVGLVTAIAGSVLMLAQNDIKKALGYSTMGQMGFMIMECGLGAFSLAIYHLITHGLFKGTLFLGAGGVISEARKDDRVPKDDLYTFVVEKRPPSKKGPWLVMAAFTLLIPVVILLAAHWVTGENVFQKQGAIVLLFFGWITGAQLIFSIYRMRTQSPIRLFGMAILSFTIVVIGYAVIGHSFDRFLYPDSDFRLQLYSATDIDSTLFYTLIAVVATIIVAGWMFVYYADSNERSLNERIQPLWLWFYALISREFYVPYIYTWLAQYILRFATRINIWLRWV